MAIVCCGVKKWTIDWSRRQWMTFISMGIIQFCKGISTSMRAPVFPLEAASKGASPMEYGFVLGLFRGTIFIVSPYIGQNLYKIGVKRTCVLGLILCGIFVGLFGLMKYINGATVFIVCCCIMRIFEAIGYGSFVTAGYAMTVHEFPDTMATIFAVVETIKGCGFILGPTLGGGLYDVGGFILPFALVGAMMLIGALIVFIILPSNFGEMKKSDEVEEKKKLLEEEKPTHTIGTDDEGVDNIEQDVYEKKTRTIGQLFLVPGVFIACAVQFACSSCFFYVLGELATHMKTEFPNINALEIGMIVVILGCSYGLCTPTFGWVCDKSKQRGAKINFIEPSNILGNVLIAGAFLAIGPAPLVASFIPKHYYVTALAVAVQGLGTAAVLVSCFALYHQEAITHGFPDNLATHGLVSGLWTAGYACGACHGPIVGGIVATYTNFTWGAIYLACWCLLTSGISTIYQGLRRSPCLGKIVDPGRIELEDLDDHKAHDANDIEVK